MKFGKVEAVEGIDLNLPNDHFETMPVIQQAAYKGKPKIYVGCAKWNKQDLQSFYPKGTKDELTYYASQFNSIEMNATFYRIFPREQFEKWKNKTPKTFRFFPKVYQGISHWKRLQNHEEYIEEYSHAVQGLEEKLGMCFLQMHENFAPNQENINRLEPFLQSWPTKIPLALELRHTNWYNDEAIADFLYTLLEQYQISNVITDTAGRRDLLHMRLTTNTAFIRYVGANDPSDYTRVEDWVERLKTWVQEGIENIYFFVHQNNEVESVKISRHFIKLLNDELGTQLTLPSVLPQQEELF